MAFLLAIVPTFYLHRYLFRRYFEKRGIVVEGLTSKILQAYVTSIGIGATVFFITMWPLLATTNSSGGPGIFEYVAGIVWAAGFLIPVVVIMKQRVGAPWRANLLITLVPMVTAVLVWNIVGQLFSNDVPGGLRDLAELIQLGGVPVAVVIIAVLFLKRKKTPAP